MTYSLEKKNTKNGSFWIEFNSFNISINTKLAKVIFNKIIRFFEEEIFINSIKI
jgi:hypothetical protein